MASRRNSMDLMRPLRRALRGIEAAQVKRFGGSVLSVLFRTRVLVLQTTGRRSGRPRETTVAYHRLPGGDLLLVGGAGGQRREPDWVANLRAHPEGSVVVERQRHAVAATEIHGHERQELWAQARSVWPQVDTYERRAGRPVPLFRLRSTAGRTESRSSCRTP